jgi:hypothetical protein
MPKLLVFTPTYGAGPEPATLASIAAQVFDGDLTHEVSWLNPYPGKDMRNVVAQYQIGRQMTLDGGYDAMLCVEHDMVLPPHAAQTLWDDGSPVVYAVYRLRHSTFVLNAWRKKGRRLGKPMSFYSNEIQQARQAKRVEVGGLGFGCTLIRRQVLERIPMRNEDNNAPDTPFAKDCLKHGIQQIARFDVACQHIENGVVLEPFGEGGIANRVYALRDAQLPFNGDMWMLERGRYYTVPPSIARAWAATGDVRITTGA